ncbi:MAG: PorT family protein [Flavobacteriales bacterium]|nr:PorT family protein [Flavobacteriales bacterium]
MKSLLTLWLFISSLSFAQESTQRKLYIGLNVSPEINGLLLGNSVGTESSTPQIGYSSGINFAFRPNKMISLRSGINFSQKRYQHLHEGLIFNSDIDPTSSFINTSTVETEVSYGLLQVPFIFQFNPQGSPFFVSAGLAYNYQLESSPYRVFHYGDGTVQVSAPVFKEASNISASMSIGYELNLNDRLQFAFEPYFQYYFVDHIISLSNLYNIGIRTSFNLGF